jgi:hypothetical protein
MQAPYVYGCLCTLAEYDGLTPPPGYSRNLRAKAAASSATVNSVPPQGVASSFVVDGFTFIYLATLQGFDNLGSGPSGPQRIGYIERSVILAYDTGTVVHELTDPDGNVFTLIVADYQMLDASGILIDQLDAFSGFSIPAGWVYSSRVLTEELIVDSGDLAVIYMTPGHSIGELSTAADGDADGVGDLVDNCPSVPNVNQANSDGADDGCGDACIKGSCAGSICTNP